MPLLREKFRLNQNAAEVAILVVAIVLIPALTFLVIRLGHVPTWMVIGISGFILVLAQMDPPVLSSKTGGTK